MFESWQFWFTCVVVLGMTISLITEYAQTVFVIFGSMMLLLLTGIISADEAFRGFSNHGVLSIGFLYVIAYAVQSTGIFNSLAPILLGKQGQSTSTRLVRFLYPVAGSSAFLNNTAIVSMLIPMVKRWSKKLNISPSKILLPLSYATILGGTCTLVGSSTNLVIHGLLIERGYDGFEFFELSKIGLPLALIGILFIALIVHRFLPNRRDVMVELGETTREYVVGLKVMPEFKHCNDTVQGAGLRHLQGLFLFQIERNGQVITPVQPDEKILVGDRLYFTGIPATIVELQRDPGLQVMKEKGTEFDFQKYDSNKVSMYESVVSAGSQLVGKSVRDSKFRDSYGAVILAIHRHGERVNKKIGDIVIQAGDTLLILAPREFYHRQYHSKEFLLVSSAEQPPSRPPGKSALILGTMIAMVALVTTGVLPMVTAAALACTLLMVTKSITINEVYQAVNWKVLVVVASSFGIAAGLENAGVAGALANFILNIGSGLGPFAIIGILTAVTILYSEVVTNNAAAALMFPVVIAIAASTGWDIRPVVYAVVFGASAAFATPISYQTNMMVQGPGNYRFRDYLRAGLPLDALSWTLITVLIYLYFFV